VQREQYLDPVDVTGVLFDQALAFAMRAPGVLLRHGRHAHHARPAARDHGALSSSIELIDGVETNLEVIGEREPSDPDVEQLLQAAEQLVAKGFVVLPYCDEDLVSCLKLANLGCVAVMPLGAPIGSGLGMSVTRP
jgi:thiazole synthase ThiGH ThiG subunit